MTVPLTPLGASTNQAGFFYHGMVTFNFNDTANPPIANTPAITWNTILNSTSIATGDFDLYSVVLHEAIHALGFRSLIDANGNSIFGPNYRYYSRYYSFLKTNNLTAILTAASSSCSLYDYSLTSGLTAAVLALLLNLAQIPALQFVLMRLSLSAQQQLFLYILLVVLVV